MHLVSLIAALLQAAAPAAPPTPADPVDGDWRTIPDDELLVMTLAGDKRVVIRLAPRYAPVHVDNLRKLARAHWWDGSSVYRVQDNYVAQWGDVTEKKPLPSSVIANPPAEYVTGSYDAVTQMTRRDPYAAKSGHSADGWPVASDGKAAWLTHCYAMVGVGRDMAPSTGSGAELYAVIGHAPRHLDRNVALIGRVVEGMEYLSSLPRGTGTMGFYAPDQTPTPIRSVRLASELPAGERPHFQYRAADNARYSAWVKGRENREPPFFEVPAGGADICNAMPPVRPTPTK
ncbi:peptidylprolyl isomerase [Sphingomonas sp. Leaf22]|uniref:peptidylprolyl isomerase n=1 Tax=Sphingomonas sp. Leaf22 TaxID=1735687 RepID=UPI000A55FAB2|nr:peptidylprolyl isomerase [Sphingomonas sp. Leaf22]